jgi:hypothetical protein
MLECSDDGLYRWELLGCWALSIARYSKEHNILEIASVSCLREGCWAPVLWDPLDRALLSGPFEQTQQSRCLQPSHLKTEIDFPKSCVLHSTEQYMKPKPPVI